MAMSSGLSRRGLEDFTFLMRKPALQTGSVGFERFTKRGGGV